MNEPSGAERAQRRAHPTADAAPAWKDDIEDVHATEARAETVPEQRRLRAGIDRLLSGETAPRPASRAAEDRR